MTHCHRRDLFTSERAVNAELLCLHLQTALSVRLWGAGGAAKDDCRATVGCVRHTMIYGIRCSGYRRFASCTVQRRCILAFANVKL